VQHEPDRQQERDDRRDRPELEADDALWAHGGSLVEAQDGARPLALATGPRLALR
jgi:hypothetical protein